MADTARSSLRVSDRSPPEMAYALLLGAYVAALVAPGVAGLVERAPFVGPIELYVAVLGVVTGTTVGVAWVVSGRSGFPERVGRSKLTWSFPLVAFAFVTAYVAVAVSGGPIAGGIAAIGALTSVVAVLLGLALGAMSHNSYVDAVVDERPVACEWRAGWPRRRRAVAVAAGAALLLAGFATLATDAVGDSPLRFLGMVGYVGGIWLLSLGQPRRYRVTPVGLEQSGQLSRRLHRWEALTGFEEREGVLVVHRRGPRVPLWFDRDDVDDSAAVVEALSAELPRR